MTLRPVVRCIQPVSIRVDTPCGPVRVSHDLFSLFATSVRSEPLRIGDVRLFALARFEAAGRVVPVEWHVFLDGPTDIRGPAHLAAARKAAPLAVDVLAGSVECALARRDCLEALLGDLRVRSRHAAALAPAEIEAARERSFRGEWPDVADFLAKVA